MKYLLVILLFLVACKSIGKVDPEKISKNESNICLACQENKGRIVDYTYPEVELPILKTKVYLPPCYDINTECNYPVLYLIHGAGGNSTELLTMELDQIMDRLIETRKIEPYIVVMPTMPSVKINGVKYQDWYSEKEWLTDELMRGIDKNFRTKKDRLYRGIGGFSQGGFLSGLYAWKHPEIFGAVGLFGSVQPAGGFIPGWTRRSPELSELLDIAPKNMIPHVYIDVGLGDGLRDENRSLTFHLRDRYMPYIFYIEKGSHTTFYWGNHLEEYLLWFNSVFGKSASRMHEIKSFQLMRLKNNKDNKNTTGEKIRIKINYPMNKSGDWPDTEIYLPPSYNSNKSHFPVLYLLHEEGMNPGQWLDMGIAEIMDKLIEEKAIPQFILVALPVDFENLDNFEPWLIENVLPDIEKQFRIINNRAWRGIAGISKGGELSINIGHKYPELFGLIGGYSATLPDDMSQLEKIIQETPINLRAQIFLDTGSEDTFRLLQKSLHHIYTIYNWPHTSTISDGEHNDAYWAKRLEYYLVSFGNAFGLEE